jgi:hypothetical protein
MTYKIRTQITLELTAEIEADSELLACLEAMTETEQHGDRINCEQTVIGIDGSPE